MASPTARRVPSRLNATTLIVSSPSTRDSMRPRRRSATKPSCVTRCRCRGAGPCARSHSSAEDADRLLPTVFSGDSARTASHHSRFDQCYPHKHVPTYGANTALLIYIGYAWVDNSITRGLAHGQYDLAA
ncbi:hypothetical protein OOK12_05090 [Streptomyces sp. NBC_00452]|nr:hypothetical protein [Streptomyces sp. NBC_00452]